MKEKRFCFMFGKYSVFFIENLVHHSIYVHIYINNSLFTQFEEEERIIFLYGFFTLTRCKKNHLLLYHNGKIQYNPVYCYNYSYIIKKSMFFDDFT